MFSRAKNIESLFHERRPCGFFVKTRSFLMFVLALFLGANQTFADEIHVMEGGTGDGSLNDPFGTIQDGIDLAQPGDVVWVHAGTYEESIQTVRDGSPGQPISIRGPQEEDEVLLTWSGRVVRVDHAYVTIENITVDGQYGQSDAVDINDGADGLVLRQLEIVHSGRDCIDMGAPSDVLIDQCLIHHCLDSTDGRTDAHGITGGSVSQLVVRDTEIHTFSGDGIQFDPGRELPGWNDILIEGCVVWLEPLSQEENGFSIGTVPGENGVDTKANDDAPRASLNIRNSIFFGFQDGLISNMAALNIKENVDALVDRVTLFDNEIALRLRGPTSSHPPGAWVRVQNTVIYDSQVAIRYEDDIENLRVFNTTVGGNVVQPFVEAEADNSVLDVRNVAVLAATLPSEALSSTNLAVSSESFVDVASNDYHLADDSPAIDSGEPLSEVPMDRDGVVRPYGSAFDVGAYEWCGDDCDPVTDPDAGPWSDGGTSQGDASITEDAGDDDASSNPIDASSTNSGGESSSGCNCRSAVVFQAVEKRHEKHWSRKDGLHILFRGFLLFLVFLVFKKKSPTD